MKYILMLVTMILSGCAAGWQLKSDGLNGFSQRNKHKEVCFETGVKTYDTAEEAYECYNQNEYLDSVRLDRWKRDGT